MAEGDVVYEQKTVRSIRGTEARTISKWEKDGWEFVSQTPGKLQTEILLRRPKPKSRALVYAIGGGALAIVLATVITIGAVNERNTDAAPPTHRPAAATTEPNSSSPPTAVPTPQSAILTPQDNPELAALLTLGDYCDASVPAFAKKYQGQQIAFDGNVGALNNHGETTTRYDILIGAGDYSETTQPGPAFQFRDVNLTSDLHYVGEVPDSLGVGTNLRILAEVDGYEPSSCLLLLAPVDTSLR